MKANTEVNQVTEFLRNGDYTAVLKQLIEKAYDVELCKHLRVEPCPDCFAAVDNLNVPSPDEL